MIEAVVRIRRRAVREVRRRHSRSPSDEIARRHPQGDHRAEDFPGDLRLGVQEQGRAEPARRGGGLSAFAARRSAGARALDVDDPEKIVDPQRRRRRAVFGAGFQDHDRPVRRSAGVHPRVLGQAERGRIGLQRRQGRARSASAAWCKMHANKREDIQEILAGDICAAVGLKTVSTGDTICDEKHPVLLESIDFPTPVIQLAIEPKTKADQEKLGMAIAEAGAGRSDVPGVDRSGNRADHSGRHGRAASRNHRRPHAARVQRGRQCRQAAGGLSRDHSPDGRVRLHAQEADRRQRPVRARQAARRAASRARDSSSTTKSRAATFRRNSSRRSRRACVEALEGGILAGYPMVGRQGDGVRRRLSRRRFVGNGVQDLRFDLRQGSAAQSQAGAARAGDARRSGGAGRVHGHR